MELAKAGTHTVPTALGPGICHKPRATESAAWPVVAGCQVTVTVSSAGAATMLRPVGAVGAASEVAAMVLDIVALPRIGPGAEMLLVPIGYTAHE